MPDYGNNRIQIFTDNGTFITKWGSEGEGNGQLKQPAVIAFDSAGFFLLQIPETPTFKFSARMVPS